MKPLKLWLLVLLLIMAAGLCGCQTVSKGQGSPEDLEAWDRQREYDPVTGKWYHTGTPGRDMMMGDYGAIERD